MTSTTRTDAVDTLRERIPAGTTVYTILRHVSASGMTRSISLVVIDEKGEPRDWSRLAARVLDSRTDERRDGIRVQGAGMDMGFHLVYSLSQELYGNGYVLNHRWL